ncbi:TetR/AcrR family transcriptional regulator [Rhodococcus sp. 3Y1]
MHENPVTRERVIAAAADLVDSKGADALVLSQLAETLDVRQSALYKHVDGVDDVHHQLSLLARSLLAEQLRAAAVGLSRDDAVMALADAWRAFVRVHPGSTPSPTATPLLRIPIWSPPSARWSTSSTR